MPDIAPHVWLAMELQGASDEAIEAELAAGPDDPQPLTDEEVAERDRLLEVLTTLQCCNMLRPLYRLCTCGYWLLPLGRICCCRHAAVSTASTELLLDCQGSTPLPYFSRGLHKAVRLRDIAGQ